jgi:hypothetical protein
MDFKKNVPVAPHHSYSLDRRGLSEAQWRAAEKAIADNAPKLKPTTYDLIGLTEEQIAVVKAAVQHVVTGETDIANTLVELRKQLGSAPSGNADLEPKILISKIK